jgi:hypothetical protein
LPKEVMSRVYPLGSFSSILSGGMMKREEWVEEWVEGSL